MIVHLCLQTSGRKESNGLVDPGPQWAVMPMGLLLLLLLLLLYYEIKCFGIKILKRVKKKANYHRYFIIS